MPDHIHILIEMGDVLTLGQVVGRIKSLSAKWGISEPKPWQRGFYDHKVRHYEPIEPILHYIYMNPYRKKLISIEEKWPYY